MHDNLPEVMINKSVSIANPVTAVTTKEYFIGKAVEYLRKSLPKFADKTNINENIDSSLTANIRSLIC